MKELLETWDIYDKNRKKTGKIAVRDKYQFKEGEYHIVVTAIILNSKNELLMSKRAGHKKYPLMWECTGGSILEGEKSLERKIREGKEELGIQFQKGDAKFLKEIRRDKIPSDFKDLWLFKKDIDINQLIFLDGEVVDAKWVTIDEFKELIKENKIIPTIDFNTEDYEKLLSYNNVE